MKWLKQLFSRAGRSEKISSGSDGKLRLDGADAQDTASFFVSSYKEEAEQRAMEEYSNAIELGRSDEAQYHREVLAEIYKNRADRK